MLWLALLSHSFLWNNEPPSLFTEQVFVGIPKPLIRFFSQCSVIDSVLKTCCKIVQDIDVATYMCVMCERHNC